MNKPRESLRTLGIVGLFVGILTIVVAIIVYVVALQGDVPNLAQAAAGIAWINYGITIAAAGFSSILFYLLAGSVAHSLKLLRVAVLRGEDAGAPIVQEDDSV